MLYFNKIDIILNGEKLLCVRNNNKIKKKHTQD